MSMERTAKPFALKILAIHTFVLLAVVVAVFAAAAGLYRNTYDHMRREAISRQELLAAEAGKGIEKYYDSILSNLDLIRRGEESPTTLPFRPERTLPERGLPSRPERADRLPIGERPDRMGNAMRTPLGLAPLLWHQLDSRVSILFGMLRTNDRVLSTFPAERHAEATEIVRQYRDWLHGVEGQAISSTLNIAGEWGHLVCVVVPAPVAVEGRVILVAAVPIERMHSLFLDELNRKASLSAKLMDDTGLVMTSSDPASAGHNLLQENADPALTALLKQCVNGTISDRRTIEVQRAGMASSGGSSRRLMTVLPFTIGDRHEKTWVLLVSSPVSDIDATVRSVFRNALIWAGILLLAVTAVLISTATHMIRSRLRLERVRNELMTRELAKARRIQLAWLPSPGNRSGPFDIAAVNQPASHISGDFYDWFELPDGRTVIWIGDVTGHGMSAAFLMATVQLLIRTTMMRVQDPGQCLEEVNRQLCCQAFNGQFVTALVAVLDLRSGAMEIANAGHFPPLLVKDHQITPLNIDSELVLGVEHDQTYPTLQVELPPSFSLVLYTDGILETCSPEGELFGVRRLLQAVRTDGSPQAIVESAVQAVRAHAGDYDLRDDLTLVAVQGQRLDNETAAISDSRNQPLAIGVGHTASCPRS